MRSVTIFNFEIKCANESLNEWKKAGHVETAQQVEQHIEALKIMRDLAKRETQTVWIVTEIIPYSNCCDCGPEDEECEYFASKELAEEYKAALIKTGIVERNVIISSIKMVI